MIWLTEGKTNIMTLGMIDKLIAEGVQLKMLAIENNDEELLNEMEEIEEMVDEIIEETERTISKES